MKNYNSLNDKKYDIPKYKVGDKVKIKSIDWYKSLYRTEYLNGKYALYYHGTGCLRFNEPMTKYCGKICEVVEVKPSITIGPTDYTEYFLSYEGERLPDRFYEAFFDN